MDVLIAGVPRSGTTLLSNLMHNPEQGCVMLNEPLASSAGHLKLHRLELYLPNEEIYPATLDDFGHGFPKIASWGIKEVWPSRWYAALVLGRPKKVVFVVRNLIDVAHSMIHLDRHKNPGDVPMTDVEVQDNLHRPHSLGAIGYFMEFVILVESMPGFQCCYVHYEKLASSPKYRNHRSRELDWPLTGDPNFALKELGRGSEIRQGIQIRHNCHSTHADYLLARQVARLNPRYQKKFGYPIIK